MDTWIGYCCGVFFICLGLSLVTISPVIWRWCPLVAGGLMTASFTVLPQWKPTQLARDMAPALSHYKYMYLKYRHVLFVQCYMIYMKYLTPSRTPKIPKHSTFLSLDNGLTKSRHTPYLPPMQNIFWILSYPDDFTQCMFKRLAQSTVWQEYCWEDGILNMQVAKMHQWVLKNGSSYELESKSCNLQRNQDICLMLN